MSVAVPTLLARGRRARRVLVPAQGALLLGAGGLAALAREPASFDAALFVMLLALSAVSAAFPLEVHGLRISTSFLGLVLAMVLLGPSPAAVIGVAVVAVDALRSRPTAQRLLGNLATYTAFPVAGGLLASWAVERIGEPSGLELALLVVAVFMVTNLLNFLLVAADVAVTAGVPVLANLREVYLPVLPAEFATGLLTAGVALAHRSMGSGVVGLLALIGVVFQYLLHTAFVAMRRGEELEGRSRELASLQVGLLATVLRTLSLRDRMTARHSAAVARYAREVAKRIGLDAREQERIHTAGLLHDIGKFIFPDSILFAATPLDGGQWEIIRRHPQQGAELVRQIDGYAPMAAIILAHHERMDGRGYPHGLVGQAIPVGARIIAVADTYDVLTARDSYREPVPPEEAIAELRRIAGTQLDPALVEVFVDVVQSRAVTFRHADNDDFEAELDLRRRVAEHARPRTPPTGLSSSV